MSDSQRWYLYRHREGGLGTSLIPPTDYANVDQYEVTGPFRNSEIVNKFVEVHNANCKAKEAAKAEAKQLGGTDA